MNKYKIGKTLFSIPFYNIFLIILTLIISKVEEVLELCYPQWSLPSLGISEELRTYLIAIIFFSAPPILLGMGLYLMIKYRDKSKPFVDLKAFFKKNKIKIIVIILILIILIIGNRVLTHYSLSCIEKNWGESNIEKVLMNFNYNQW